MSSGKESEVPLSERDRRVLAEIERGLLEADRSPAKHDRARGFGRGSALAGSACCMLGVLVGLAYVLFGAISAGVLGVLGAVIGYVIVVASCAGGIRVYRGRRGTTPREDRS